MKLDKIRLATDEEVTSIAKDSDLTQSSRVLAMGKNLAVWRVANELDPFHFDPEASNTNKYVFLWGLETLLRGSGVNELYFNVHVADTQFRNVVEHLGAVATSTEPELRYKITL